MKKIPLLTNDLASTVRSVAKLQIVLPPKDMTFDVWLEVDDALLEKIKNDSYLADKMFTEVSKIYKVAASHLAKEAERIEKEVFAKGKSKQWVVKEWETTVPPILEKFEPVLQNKAQGHLKTWQKVTKDANKYVVRCVFKVAVGTVGVATATLGAVVAFKKKTVGREFATEFFNGLSSKEMKNINGLSTNFDSFKGKLDRIEKNLSSLGAAFTGFSKLDQPLVFIDTVGVEIDNVLAEEI